ncbi:YwiC-like family protein [Aquihabitans daechungensis]|uniref:YwiC-like family protein n=1 Tax=Aquihabitans daechungensis TaxID=1052257 RepID=UPI003BA343D1
MLPAEHGGWGLTLEPALLGLLVAPSVAGACIALGAVVAFLVRTPLRIAAVDRRRGRKLDRTHLARRVALVELALLAVLGAASLALGEPRFWVPLLVAVPMLGVAASFEVRSRGRRLIPELAGAVGVCSVASMIVLADGGTGRLAAGVWLVLAGRVVTSIPHVRGQIARLHHRPSSAQVTLAGDAAAVALGLAAVGLEQGLGAGALAVCAVVVAQRVADRRPVPRPAVLGMRQMAMGFAVVLATAIGVLAHAS